MRRVHGRKERRWGGAWLAACGVGGSIVCFTVASALRYDSDPSPADIVVMRFSEIPSPAPASAAAPRAAREPRADAALFDPNPIYPVRTARTEPPADALALAPQEEAAIPDPDEQAASIPTPRPAPARRRVAAPTRPDTVLTDAQIAGLMKRLNLTEDQKRYWPAVAAALRDIKWRRDMPRARRAGARTADRLASIDVDSDAVQRLKSAAFPLIMSFSEEQKREVRKLAEIIGLGSLAAQF